MLSRWVPGGGRLLSGSLDRNGTPVGTGHRFLLLPPATLRRCRAGGRQVSQRGRARAGCSSPRRESQEVLPTSACGYRGRVGEGAGRPETDGSLRAKSNRLSFSESHLSMSHSSMGGPGEKGWVPQHSRPLYSSPWYGQGPLGLAERPARQGPLEGHASHRAGSLGLCLAAIGPA